MQWTGQWKPELSWGFYIMESVQRIGDSDISQYTHGHTDKHNKPKHALKPRYAFWWETLLWTFTPIFQIIVPPSLLFNFCFACVCVCLDICAPPCVYLVPSEPRREGEHIGFLGAGGTHGYEPPERVLGTKPRSSERAASALNCWAVSPAPLLDCHYWSEISTF